MGHSNTTWSAEAEFQMDFQFRTTELYECWAHGGGGQGRDRARENGKEEIYTVGAYEFKRLSGRPHRTVIVPVTGFIIKSRGTKASVAYEVYIRIDRHRLQNKFERYRPNMQECHVKTLTGVGRSLESFLWEAQRSYPSLQQRCMPRRALLLHALLKFLWAVTDCDSGRFFSD